MKRWTKFQAAVRVATFSVAVATFAAPALPAIATAPYTATDVLGQPNFTSTGTDGMTDVNAAGLNGANGTAIDPVAHRLYIADTHNARVVEYDLTVGNALVDHTPDHILGQPNFTSNNIVVDQKGFTEPWAVAVDPTTSRVFVADRMANRVMVFDASSLGNYQFASYVLGQPNFLSSTAATTQTGMDEPASLAFDASGQRLFVGDKNNGRVLVFDTATTVTGEPAVKVLGKADFTHSGCGAPSAVNLCGSATSSDLDLMGLTYDAANQRLFVTDTGFNRILAFDTATLIDGEPAVSVLGQSAMNTSGPHLTASGLSDMALGLAYDPAGHRLFAADDKRILAFDVTVIIDGEPAVSVLGQSDFTSQVAASGPGSFAAVNGLSYESGSNRLYAGDVGHSRILAFDTASITDGEDSVDVLGHLDNAGTPRFDWQGTNDLHARPAGFDTPSDAVVDPVAHRLFVADSNNARVVVYNLDAANNFSDRTVTAVLGQPDAYAQASAVSQTGLSYPGALAIDVARHWLFVADSYRILIYDVSTVVTGEPAAHVLGEPNFNTSAAPGIGAFALAYDSVHHRLFASEPGLNRVLVFDLTSPIDGQPASFVIGQPNLGASAPGTSATQLTSPFGLAYDSVHSRLFVSDLGNLRVLEYDTSILTSGMPASKVLGQTDLNSAVNLPPSRTAIAVPYTLSYDPGAEQLFVTDTFGAMRVLVFDVAAITNNEPAVAVLGQADFTSVSNVGPSGTAFNINLGVHFDSAARHLLVTEWLGNRILLFELIRLTTGILPSGTVGYSYTGALTAVHGQGTPSYAVTSGTLPPGLVLSANGFIAGSPTVAGAFTFAVSAVDDNGAIGAFKDTQTLSITVAAVPAVTQAKTTPKTRLATTKAATTPVPAAATPLPTATPNPTPFPTPSFSSPASSPRPTAPAVPVNWMPGAAVVAGLGLVLLVIGLRVVARRLTSGAK